MSRVGKSPIALPQGVTFSVSANNVVTVKGPKGELHQAIDGDHGCSGFDPGWPPLASTDQQVG